MKSKQKLSFVGDAKVHTTESFKQMRTFMTYCYIYTLNSEVVFAKWKVKLTCVRSQQICRSDTE